MKTEKKRVVLETNDEIALYLGRALRLEACPEKELIPVPEPKKLYDSLDEAQQDIARIEEIKEENKRRKEWNRRKTHLRFAFSEAIERSIPFYQWIRVKVGEASYAIGVCTGTWGGYCQSLSIVDLAKHEIDSLPKLEHTTYYP